MRVVIIGGSSGLGLATARQLHAIGAELILGGRSPERLQKAKATLGSQRVEALPVDVRDEHSLSTFFERIGPFDHLITPGNHTYPGSFGDLAEAKESFVSKYWGQYMAARSGHPYIREGGSIVFFSGVLGTRPSKNCAIMASVNGAIEALTRALAVDLAPRVRVNAVAPGSIESPRLLELAQKNPSAGFDLVQGLPIPRLGHPEEVAEAVAYLTRNGYVTGTVLYVDGGYGACGSC